MVNYYRSGKKSRVARLMVALRVKLGAVLSSWKAGGKASYSAKKALGLSGC